MNNKRGVVGWLLAFSVILNILMGGAIVYLVMQDKESPTIATSQTDIYAESNEVLGETDTVSDSDPLIIGQPEEITTTTAESSTTADTTTTKRTTTKRTGAKKTNSTTAATTVAPPPPPPEEKTTKPAPTTQPAGDDDAEFLDVWA